MNTSPRPKPITYSSRIETKGFPSASKQVGAARRISVNTLLPLSAALLFVLGSATPAVPVVVESPDDGGLEALRVELATMRAEVATLRERAEEKIELYRQEAERLEEATEDREAAERRSKAAAERLEERRLGAARQAADAYKGADPDIRNAWTGPEGPVGLLERGAYLTLLGEYRSAELGRAEAARVATDTLEGAAGTAEEEQIEATEAAEQARDEALEAIDEQEERARGLLEQQTALETAVGPTEAEGGFQNSAALPEEALTRAHSPTTVGGTTTDGCAGGDSTRFDNGRIPNTLLCPLPQPGETLRADAAEAFIELDGAYRAEFGRSMCVTDSYRPYHEQVRLFQEMLPGMAARPGTSAHGLGLAVDLCGGVHDPKSAEHRWMLANGPSHGWDNPHWARGGFEPWHWEYTP